MSVKDVREYYMKMTADYMELKETLSILESEVTPETSELALKNIDAIKQRVAKLQENYNRINYIMFLLDMPQRKNKKVKWVNQEKKRLDAIPEKDRLEFIQKENKEIVDGLKSYIKC